MATKKPLVELIPDILAHVRRHEETMEFNLRLYKIDEGQIRPEIEASLKREMISDAAFNRAKERIPSINLIKKATDKLSKVYTQSPVRTTETETDNKIMTDLSNTMAVDKVMSCVNRLINLQRMCAVEPFIQDGKQSLRVLAAHQFLPFSDDTQNPLNMTVFIKFMGNEIKKTMSADDKDGVRNTDEDSPRRVGILHLYSDNEFLIIDTDGHIHTDKMAEMDAPWSAGKNPIGVIPQEYYNASQFELVPFVNKTALDIAILIPKLLTDLNYAAQFQSHSIIWSKNADLSGVEIHPDTVLNLGEGNSQEGEPEIGTISPTIEIEGTLQLIEFQISTYLSSIGIKASTTGSMMPGREASGFAKAMDEGDVTAERKVQVEVFKHFEKRLWSKISKLQAYWSSQSIVDDKRKFSEKFVKSFSVKFGDMKHLVSQTETLEKVKLMKELGIISEKQILKELNPDWTPDQIDQYMSDLEEARKKNPVSVEPSTNAPQFNGQTEVGTEEDNVGPNKEAKA